MSVNNDYPLEETIHILFTSRRFSTGAPFTLAGTPALSVYEDASLTQITAGVSVSADHDSVTGLNLATIVATAANGYESGKSYHVVITTGTVDSVSVVGEVVGGFSIERSAAAVDLANATDGLGAIKAETANILTDTAEIGAAGAGLTEAGGTGDHLTALPLNDLSLAQTIGYLGPRGPGIYLNDAAANTNTTFGTDGTIGNPVSTIAAAKTIADAQSIDRIYLVNDSAITLAADMSDYEFVGIGELTANVVNLGGQILTNSTFYNLTIEGDGSASAGRIYAEDCALQDPGAGVTTLNIYARNCGIVDDITIDTSNDNVFDQCFSLVAGSGTPIIRASGAAGTVSVRHYSGGIEFATLSASHNVSVETDGQVVFNADCNVNANVSLRGNMTITDNTAGMNSVTQEAVFNRAAINAEVLNVMNTDTITLPGQTAPPLTPTHRQAIAWLYKTLRNRTSQTATQWSLYGDDETTVDAKATVSDDATTAIKQEIVSGP